MSQVQTSAWQLQDYERAAMEYMVNLPPEHHMEGVPHATQREITVESMALLKARRHDLLSFNELLVQFRRGDGLRQVCPDNMLALGKATLSSQTSFNVDLEPARILCVIEYVSPSNKRKDYVENFQIYQDELRAPYYLVFDPESDDLKLFRHDGTKYRLVAPNARGRLELSELDLEIGLQGGWVRYWHQGDLMPLPTELSEQLQASQAETKAALFQADRFKRDAESERHRAEAAEARIRELERQMNPPGDR